VNLLALTKSRNLLDNRTILPPNKHPAKVYLAHLAKGSSRVSMASTLEKVARLISRDRFGAEEFPWHRLHTAHLEAIRSELRERYKPATANKYLAAIRGVLKAAWKLDLISTDEYQKAISVDPVRGETLPRGRALTSGELRALFEACAADQTPAGRRDAALMAVLYGAGLRRAEAVALDLADYSPDTGELRILGGKGRKDRIAYATNGALLALEGWLKVRRSESGPLLLPVSQMGEIQYRRMTTQAVYFVLRKRAKEASIPSFSPHDLRRSFISDLLDCGADISLVQQLAGHAKVTTTQRYDRRPEAAKKKAAEMLIMPFVPPK
jgi:site-specific recombinase XerD